jgi:hypothetical protein
MKRLFKQSQIVAQLDSCEAELKAALQILTVGGHFQNRSSLIFVAKD